MFKSNKILSVTGASATTFNYQIGAGHLNGLYFNVSAPAQVNVQVLIKGQKSEVLINNITLDRLQGISDFYFGVGSAHNINRMVIEGLDNEAAVESAYPEYAAEASPKVGIMVPLGSIHFENGIEMHVTLTVGTSCDIELSEVSYNSDPDHYLAITQYLATNETYSNVIAAFLHRTTYNHVADVEIRTNRFGAAINSLDQMNAISAALGKSESYRNYFSTCVFKSDMDMAEAIQIKLSGTNAASIYTIIIAKYVNMSAFVSSIVKNVAAQASNPVQAAINNAKAQISKQKAQIKPGISFTSKVKSLIPAING